VKYLNDDGMEPGYCEIHFQMDVEVTKAAREYLRERVVVHDRDAGREVNKELDENEQIEKLAKTSQNVVHRPFTFVDTCSLLSILIRLSVYFELYGRGMRMEGTRRYRKGDVFKQFTIFI
jgi:hypothetical protein